MGGDRPSTKIDRLKFYANEAVRTKPDDYLGASLGVQRPVPPGLLWDTYRCHVWTQLGSADGDANVESRPVSRLVCVLSQRRASCAAAKDK